MNCLNHDGMIVSIIVPLYFGRRYIDGIQKMCKEALIAANIIGQAEIIFVNDSPEENIEDVKLNNGAKIITNNMNLGIHASRVQGILHSTGNYIHLLDQDDRIESSFYYSQLKQIKEADMIVCNAIVEHKTYQRKLYRGWFSRAMISNPRSYAILGNRIESPGQCLIKKSAIPIEWMNNIQKINGADDYLLWLMMFGNHISIRINKHLLYTHVYTSENLSLDKRNMLASVKESLILLKERQSDNYLIPQLKKYISYLEDEESNFINAFKGQYFLYWLIGIIRNLSIQIRG